MMRRYCGLFCAALLLLSVSSVSAQEFRATVKGQVVDSSKAALPGATVTVQNPTPTKWRPPRRTAKGNYTVPFLRPGHLHADRRDERVPEAHAHRHAARGQPDRDDQSRSSASAA